MRSRERSRAIASASTPRRSVGNLRVLLQSNVRRIEADKVVVEHAGRSLELPNDAVIISAGGILPTDFLRKVGVDVETKYGTA